MRALLLVLLPLALLAQPGTISVGLNDTALRGSTSLIIRGGGPGDQQTTTLLPLPVWKATDGSKWVWVKGEPHRISLPPPRVEWRDYVAYGGAVIADYASSRALMKSGGREVVYQCSPPRLGCMNTPRFLAVSAPPVAAMALWDIWGRSRAKKRLHKAQSLGRKINTGLRLGVAVSNIVQAK